MLIPFFEKCICCRLWLDFGFCGGRTRAETFTRMYGERPRAEMFTCSVFIVIISYLPAKRRSAIDPRKNHVCACSADTDCHCETALAIPCHHSNVKLMSSFCKQFLKLTVFKDFDRLLHVSVRKLGSLRFGTSGPGRAHVLEEAQVPRGPKKGIDLKKSREKHGSRKGLRS